MLKLALPVRALRAVSVLSFFVLTPATGLAADVTVRVVDQFGNDVPNALISIPFDAPAVPSGTVLDLVEGNSYSVNLYISGGLLKRSPSPVLITPGTTTLDFEWQTRDVTLSILDQDSLQIAGSRIVSLAGTFDTGTVAALPINDSSYYPDLDPAAALTDNYAFLLSLFTGQLVRRVEGYVVGDFASNLNFAWERRNVILRVVDQLGADLGPSSVGLQGNFVPSGATLKIPINDFAFYPDLLDFGLKDNYTLVPTLFTQRLLRFDAGIVIGAASTEEELAWITRRGTLNVVDGNEDIVPGSQVTIDTDMQTIPTGTFVELPVTDNTVYPTLAGAFAGGYPITVEPATVAAVDTLAFEVLATGELLPQFFDIGGMTFGLRLELDPNPPVVTITTPADGAVLGTSSTSVSADILEIGGTTVFSMPAGISATLPPGGGTVSGTILLGEGSNTVVLVATDQSGNIGGDSISVVVDTIAPNAGVLSPAAGATVSMPDIVLSIGVFDATATVVTIGGSSMPVPAGGGIADFDLTLAEGPNIITIDVVDAAGNSITVLHDLNLDASAPVVTIDSPLNGDCFGPGDDPLSVSVTVDDASATTVSSTPAGVSGSLPAGGGVVVGAVPLVEGSNTITVEAVDALGQTGSEAISVIYDTTAPDITLTSPVDGEALGGTIDLHAVVSDPVPGSGVDRVEFDVDGNAVATVTTFPYGVVYDSAALADGSHTFTATVYDGKGNFASQSSTVTIDNTAPQLTVLNPVDGSYVSGTMPLDGQVTDSGSGVVSVLVLVDGAAPTVDPSVDLTTPQALVTLAGEENTLLRPDGPLGITLVAMDAVGNTSGASLLVTVDNTAPPKSLTSPVEGQTVAGIITVATDSQAADLDSVELLVDGQSIGTSGLVPYSLQFDTRSRLDGLMQVSAVLTDFAGNSSACTATVRVDNISAVFRPQALDITRADKAGGNEDDDRYVGVRFQGPNVGLMLPTEDHAIQLLVPGGRPVTALTGYDGDDAVVGTGDDAILSVRFSRRAMVNAILAGIANGTIPDGTSLINVEVVADGFSISSEPLTISVQ